MFGDYKYDGSTLRNDEWTKFSAWRDSKLAGVQQQQQKIHLLVQISAKQLKQSKETATIARDVHRRCSHG